MFMRVKSCSSKQCRRFDRAVLGCVHLKGVYGVLRYFSPYVDKDFLFMNTTRSSIHVGSTRGEKYEHLGKTIYSMKYIAYY